ncbi:MAG TPA: oligosaccharide flippase family protein [Polyangiaceae bacterium]|nr:oligosaccharide flippase family protein [Polyangiaceae bacterium]
MQETSPPPSEATAPPTETAEASAAAPPGGNQRALLRNTLYLTMAQAATVPLAVVTNALLGRYLGPESFGHIYLATTLCSFAVLALEWGQQGALPALIARERPRAAAYLGTSLVWRGAMAIVISGVLAVVCQLLGYNGAQKWAVALSFPVSVLVSSGTAFKDTFRGFERTDIPALAHVTQQFLGLLVVVPVLLLGGRLRSVLLVNMAVGALIAVALRVALRSLSLGKLRFERSALKSLFAIGTPFVLFDLAMVLLTNVNANFLAKLSPPEVMGWFSVSQRLIGLLIFPASALIGALYPTLCRLQAEDQPEFARVTRNALYGTSLLAVPAAVGCGIFAEIGVAVFDSAKYAGAIAHLRVMSAFVFLVYLSMPIGTCILAANRQRAWALVQGACVVLSLCCSPFLIPYFQKLNGNGAIGTCVTLVLSEAFVVGCGVALAPRGVFNAELFKSLFLAALSGAAMAVVAWLLKPISLFLAVPAAVVTYGAVAWLTGALQPATIEMIKGTLARRLGRGR